MCSYLLSSRISFEDFHQVELRGTILRGSITSLKDDIASTTSCVKVWPTPDVPIRIVGLMAYARNRITINITNNLVIIQDTIFDF